MHNDDYQMGHYYTNRYICDVIEEMRKCYETRNFTYLPGLIEEAQSLANRMEGALADQKDLRRASEELVKVKKLLKKSVEKLNKIKRQVRDLEKQLPSEKKEED